MAETLEVKVPMPVVFSACPICHVPCVLVESPQGDYTPNVGDVTICSRCGGTSIYELDRKRPLTEVDFQALHPETQAGLKTFMAKWPGQKGRQ